MWDSEHPETEASPVASAWRPSRRTALGALAASVAVPMLTGAHRADASAGTTPALLYIGTWRGTQVNGARFDPDGATMTPFGVVAQVNASWQAKHPSKPVLYVGSGDPGGTVSAFRIDRASGALDLIGRVTTDSAGTPGGLSYIGVDRPSGTVLAANFAAGLVAALPIRQDGGLDSPVSTVVDTGSGPHPRQTGPHPHHVAVDPSGTFALVADFGADRVFIYRFNRETRVLSADETTGPRFYAANPGSGPRRLLFHPNGRTLYLLNELTADLQVLDWSSRKGELTSGQSLSTDSPEYAGPKSAAELGMSRDGRFVYTSNRGENTIVVFAADRRTGRLTLVQRIPCGGLSPWSFTIHRGGRWMLVANQVSSTVTLFSIDPRSGKLTDTGTSMPVPNPDCITFGYRASSVVISAN
ncbi:lactonase family protein [Nonomuraea sp. NEAU-A123]|uniref:lactonase family protein n=1 Tax=Nonomuraea sp. NEAU-A123 TaxID=2839649 RepID=UPI001BE4070E|nr:lactonase family protein [Nonomuraea sp. NEAU-A123]MBT2227828.1 beta-propeller fold lactonase family protein [Nonomuraea sp. NEAU-A123]